MEYDNDYWPRVDGQGSLHDISSDSGRMFGQQGARIIVRLKARPIGFQIPKKAHKSR